MTSSVRPVTPAPSAQRHGRQGARTPASPAAAASGAAAGSALTPTCVPWSSGLNEYDVVLVNPVECLDLQSDRPTDLRLELAQRGGFLVQQAVHNVLMSQYQQLTAGKLSALAHYLAKNLVANRLRRSDETASFAARTRFTQQVLQALAGALAGHLDQSQWREAHDVGLGAVAGQRPLERGEHRAPVRLVAHVDEVDDDDAAEIAQAQLPG